MNKDKIIDALIGFLRPKYYNKITWTVVIAGVSLVSTSIFETILNEILKNNLKINIIGDQDGIYGLILVFLGLAYNVSGQFIELRRDQFDSKAKGDDASRNLNHDLEIFKTSDKLLNEDDLDRILDRLSGGHEAYWDELTKIWEYNKYFKLKSNKFLTDKLSKTNSTCYEALEKLSSFVGAKFFVTKYDPKILQMHPELNWDRTRMGVPDGGEKKYNEMVVELNNLIRTVDKTYGEYRVTVKEILKQ